MRRRLGLLAVLVAGWGATSAGAQTVRLYAPSDSVYVGERFAVGVAVERAAGQQVLFPEPPSGGDRLALPLRAGDAELLGVRRFPPALRGEARVDSAVYEGVTFALDEAWVGPLAVRVVTGGDTLRVPSPTARLPVRSVVPPEAEGPEGLLPPSPFPRPLALWLLGAFVVLAALLAALALRRRRGPEPEASLPPAEAARRALDALEAEPPPPGADPGPYYDALAGALRRYLARTLGVPALEQTSGELLAALDAHPEPLPEEARAATARVLHRADLVKFAGATPPPEAHAETLRQARAALDAADAHREALRREAEAADAEQA
jgi:hypothetical protein